jgi:Ca2+-binding RTX toxin-like protein
MGLDQFGAVLSTQPTFTWATTVGTVTTSGVLTTSANVPGTGTVTATSGLASGSATVNVLPTEMVPDLTSPGKTALYVFGTAGNNKILVNPASGPGTVAGAVAVLFNGTLVGTFDPTSRICVYGYGASDYIQVSPSITLSAWLFGGSGTNYLYGGGGNDVIVGGPGTNYISGGAGRNLLIGGGGGGPNYIQGTTGDNIEISGTTSYNANEAALNAILQEWASGDSYSVRVDKITGTNGYSLSADGSQVILNSSTIQQVAACEYLYSGSGQDLFFATETGSVYDRDYVIKRKTTGLNAEMELPN